MILCAAKITKLLKGFRQPSTNHNNIEILTWSCVDCQKNWASYQERKDWRSYHGFHNSDESWIRRWLSIEKPQSFCLVRSCHNINCSSVFTKIDILLPLKLAYQHLSGSRLFAWLRQIPCNHHFLGGIIQTRDGMSWWGPRPFQLNKCKSFKNRAQFVKDDVIDHFVTRTSSE